MEGNLDPKISLQAEEEGINVQKVITEEVVSSSTDSFQKLMRESTRTPSTSGPSGGACSEFQIINSDSDSSGDINRYSGGEARSGYERESPIQERLSPFTGEEYYTHATQDEDHGIRNVGPGIGAGGKDYTRREKGTMKMSCQEENSFSTNFGSMRVQGEYNPYSMDVYGMSSSSNSWIHSQAQPSGDSSYGQSQPISYPYYDYQQGQSHVVAYPYAWHINNYMQNYQGDVSFDQYFSQYTTGNKNEENSFQPPRNSMWY